MKIWLWDGAEIGIGRCGTPGKPHLILAAPSVGRRHATLKVTKGESGLNAILTDENSKFGTQVNGVRITAPVELKLGNLITFAESEKVFCLEEYLMMTVFSSLVSSEKAKISGILGSIGITVANEIDQNCTSLCMSSFILTAKALKAIVEGIPIVTPDYFVQLEKAIVSTGSIKQILPPPDAFPPPIQEPSLIGQPVSFRFHPNRKTLFNGRKFLILSKTQFDRMSDAIRLGGGEPVPVVARKYDADMTDCLMLLPPEAEKPTNARERHDLLAAYKATGNRLVHDSEISLSLVFCSADQFDWFNKDTTELSQASTVSEPDGKLNSFSRVPIAKATSADVKTTGSNQCEEVLEVPDSQEAISRKRILQEVPESPGCAVASSTETPAGKSDNLETTIAVCEPMPVVEPEWSYSEVVFRKSSPAALCDPTGSVSPCRNFKRFKKVQRIRTAHTIIGGSDLLPHVEVVPEKDDTDPFWTETA